MKFVVSRVAFLASTLCLAACEGKLAESNDASVRDASWFDSTFLDAQSLDAQPFDVGRDSALDASGPRPAWQNTAETISPSETGRNFGFSLSLSPDGEILVVGDLEDAITVYDRSNGAWRPISRLDTGSNNVGIGVAVSRGGEWIAVGVSGNEQKVMIFERQGNSWTLENTYTGIGNYHLSISHAGDVLVGSELFPSHNERAALIRSGNQWSKHVLPAVPSDMVGVPNDMAVSGDGNTIVFGHGKTNTHARSIYAFKRNGTSFSQPASLTALADSNGNQSPSLALSFDGSVLAVGLRDAFPEGTGYSYGAAAVYHRTSDLWSDAHELPRTNRQPSWGNSISLSADGRVVAVGAFESSRFEVLVRTESSSAQNNWMPETNQLAPQVGLSGAGWIVSMSADGNSLAVGLRNGGHDSYGRVAYYRRQ